VRVVAEVGRGKRYISRLVRSILRENGSDSILLLFFESSTGSETFDP